MIIFAAWCITTPLKAELKDHSVTHPAGPDIPIVFESEIIKIFIEPDSVRIDGLYFLRGAGQRPQVVRLNYPYPQDELLGGARTDLLEARTSGSWVPLSFTERGDGTGANWYVPVNPGSLLEVRTVYRQQRAASYAKYIVTTTRAWESPLQSARFEIYLPDGAQPTQFSYDFHKGVGSHGPCWIWEQTDFWPDRDISVSWD